MTAGGRLARKGSVRSSRVRRDASVIASELDSLLDPAALAGSGRALLDVEDRRQFYPAVHYRPARTFRGWARLGLVAPQSNRSSRARSAMTGPISFRAPEATLVCVRRHQRREVLHALKKTGGRGGRQRRPRRNVFSSVSCRRR